jgi:lipid A ethanolaminephosphotransferase
MNICHPKATTAHLALIGAIFLVLVDNQLFWHSLFKIVDVSTINGLSLAWSVFVILVAVLSSLLLMFGGRYLFRPILIIVLIMASVIGYFQAEYSVIFDERMMQNIAQTDYKEATELMRFQLFLHVVIFGLLPALAVGLVHVQYKPFIKELFLRIVCVLFALVLASLLIFSNYKNLALIGREHRELRLLINPTYPVYAAYKYAKSKIYSQVVVVQPIGMDAKQKAAYLDTEKKTHKKTMVVFVVGETARAKNFSLNGYERETNSHLAKDEVISFDNTYSCGTDTAESVPCIFSHFDRAGYSVGKAAQYQNVLDILSRAGVQVLWRDNNSGCKGVCSRVTMEDLAKLAVPDLCNDEECFDEILLHKLQDRVKQATADILIVLHQKGSHGPAYYKRHPQRFSLFHPECTTNAPQHCETEELINSYDNTLLYTDYFLHQTIEFLKNITDRYNTLMIYVSDHGESLGENGIYLHGLPYFISPDEQRHIPFIIWLSNEYAEAYHIRKECLIKQQHQPYSHDNIFHSLLGLFGVETELYKQDHDVFWQCHG